MLFYPDLTLTLALSCVQAHKLQGMPVSNTQVDVCIRHALMALARIFIPMPGTLTSPSMWAALTGCFSCCTGSCERSSAVPSRVRQFRTEYFSTRNQGQDSRLESLNQYFGDDALLRIFTHTYDAAELTLATNVLAILFEVCLLERPVDLTWVRPACYPLVTLHKACSAHLLCCVCAAYSAHPA